MILRSRRTTYKSESTAANWPAWTDHHFWETSEFPTADEARWWARHAPHRDLEFDVEGPDERACLEGAAPDAIEPGDRPSDEEARAAMSIVWLRLSSDR